VSWHGVAIRDAWRGPLVGLSVSVLVVGHHLVELLINAAGPAARFGKLIDLGEWLTQAPARMNDLTMGSIDVVKGFLLAGFEAVKAILDPGNQSGGVCGLEVGDRDLDGAVRDAVEVECRGRLAHGSLDRSVEGEAAE